jgi:SH3-like domain-containing protein
MLIGRGHRAIPAFGTNLRWLVGALMALLLALASSAAIPPMAFAAEGIQTGSVTGLRLPRYASLRFDKTNVREGPTKNHRTAWIFQRAGLPVEIIGEFDTWRRIRDSEGGEGWVLASLLSGRRTALVAPWRKSDLFPIYAKPGAPEVVARLQSGVLANIKTCQGNWCRVFGEGFDGFIPQGDLWGAYPEEPI